MLFILYFLIHFILSLPGQNEDHIKKAVLGELKHYPETQLRDIYKNFFQDAYGPGHLIPDSTHAGKYLDIELNNP